MSLFPKQSPLEIDQALTLTDILTASEALNNLVVTLSNCYARFWSREPSAILAELNADVARMGAILASNAELVAPANAQLDIVALPQYSTRAVNAMPTGFAFDGTQFTYTAPVVIVPDQPAPLSP